MTREMARIEDGVSTGSGSSRIGTVALGAAILAFTMWRGHSADPRGGKHGDHAGAGAGTSAKSKTARGREAETPTQIPARGWTDILLRVYNEISEDRVLAVAAGVTFYALLAIFPALTAFVSLYGLIADRATLSEHLNALSGVMPGGGMEIISEQLTRLTSQPEQALGFGFVFGLALALWSANAGMKALFDAINVAYGEREKRGFFALNLLSLSFTVGAILFLVIGLIAIVVVPIVLNWFGLQGATEGLLAMLRWPVMLVVAALAISLLYRFGPSRERAKWRWVSVGSVVAALLWLGGSLLFSWYVTNFGSYNETYGSLGAAIGFMTWMWLSTVIILVGAELNSEAEHQTAKDSTSGAPKPMGERGAQMADNVAG
ncbi:YihY/virulence factor BrkB family protein [Terrihabitans rhizophilus]|uniref:YihY/virulence factor BrkB family protein n=1 Tax=Terrihabitans rhizophilus TaxID=3092662 RepID=A0ABU4RKI2_9HYPH|nr:YihY/virulence factor BrkB family protein [Terrihabitans sp. PJ23]MDX6805317.1 YihY/virulence factor BrkB family protein [Terrihabitans sp. PJ23]